MGIANGELNQAVIDIIESFEEFLERRGIDVPNPEKEESEGPCTIYGTDFGELYDEVELMLKTHDLLFEDEETKLIVDALLVLAIETENLERKQAAIGLANKVGKKIRKNTYLHID